MTARLPARLEVSALVRSVEAAGGFAMVLARGEPDAGTIMVITHCGGKDFKAFERMPQADGTRGWQCARQAADARDEEFQGWIDRRRARDPDLWIVELDIADAERFI